MNIGTGFKFRSHYFWLGVEFNGTNHLKSLGPSRIDHSVVDRLVKRLTLTKRNQTSEKKIVYIESRGTINSSLNQLLNRNSNWKLSRIIYKEQRDWTKLISKQTGRTAECKSNIPDDVRSQPKRLVLITMSFSGGPVCLPPCLLSDQHIAG